MNETENPVALADTDETPVPLGRFAVLVDRHPFDFLPIFAQVVPVLAEPAAEGQIIYYLGYSPLFRPVDQTGPIPAYQFRIDTGEDGQQQVTAVELAEGQA